MLFKRQKYSEIGLDHKIDSGLNHQFVFKTVLVSWDTFDGKNPSRSVHFKNKNVTT